MFASLGGVLSSSLTDLSKSITNSIASQLNPLGYARQTYADDSESSGANSPLPIDVDVLLSYYGSVEEHRPSSRLLRERAFEVGQKGPRSATLLVSGSPVFERPWRCRAPVDALESDGLAQAATELGRRNRTLVLSSGGTRRSGAARVVDDESRAQGSSSLGAGCPMLGGSATRERQVWQEGRRRSDERQHKRRRRQKRNQQQGHQRQQSHQQHQGLRRREQRQQQTGGSPRASQTLACLETAFAEPRCRRQRSRSRVTTQTGRKASAGAPSPEAAARPLPQLLNSTELTETSLVADALQGRTSPSTIAQAGNDHERSASAQGVGRELSRFGREPNSSRSARPSTAPCALPLPPQPRRSFHDDRCSGAERGDEKRGINTPRVDASCEGSRTPPDRGERQSSSSADTFLRRCADHSGTPVATSRLEGLDFDEMTAATRSGAPRVQRPATTSLLDADPAAFVSINLRPSTAEAPRRSSIEADATISRSSRLPRTAVSTSFSLGSERDCIRTGGFSLFGGVIGGEGSTITNNNLNSGEGSGLGGPYPKDTGAKRYDSLHGRRARNDHPQQHQNQRPTSPPDSVCVQPFGGAAEGELSRSRTASTAAFAGAAVAPGAPWRRRGQVGDLDSCADRACVRRTRINNGAVTGAEWGGEDQMTRIAVAPMPSGQFGQKRRSDSGISGAIGKGERPDTRERFYEVHAESLKSLRPCLRCFDALMLHLRDPRVVETRTSWTSAAAAEDPHVAVFVRWESFDSDLGRYIPRGFAGSFTPRPFRPALVEYAVKAAIGDPNFWGLGWTQIPLTRCRVTVVKSFEVAQNELDWLSNRHGLILSFKDGAERHYQSAIFPETLYKAGWSKERTIDALYQKAGYWKPRRMRAESKTPLKDTHHVTANTVPGHEDTADPVISQTAVMLRFETVTFRMRFQKYQRAKAAAAARRPKV